MKPFKSTSIHASCYFIIYPINQSKPLRNPIMFSFMLSLSVCCVAAAGADGDFPKTQWVSIIFVIIVPAFISQDPWGEIPSPIINEMWKYSAILGGN